MFAAALVAALIVGFEQGDGRSAGNGAFVGDFEVRSPGWQQFDGLDYEEDRPLSDSFAVVESPVRQGHLAARVTVRQGYSRHGYNENTQLVFRGDEREGDEYWYAWSTLFPREWTSPDRFGIFAEWHANLDTSPIIGFSARGDSANLTLLSGLADEQLNGASVDRVVPVLSTLSKGRWNDFVVHVRWSLRDGFVEVFHKVEGESKLRKLASFRAVPTFQVTAAGRGVGTYLLLGIYRGSYCPQPTQLDCTSSRGVQAPSTVYHDGFARARTFAEAVSRAFPGAPTRLPRAGTPALQTDGASMKPITIRARARESGTQAERGCRVTTLPGGQGLRARIAGGADDRDTAVAVYSLRQRSAIVVRARMSVDARDIAAPLVLTQLRKRRGEVLVELYARNHSLWLSSPPGTLRPEGFDVDTGIAMGLGADVRTVELRLRPTALLVGVNARAVVRLGGLRGPRAGTRVTVRVGVERYDVAARVRAVGADFDELVVGVS